MIIDDAHELSAEVLQLLTRLLDSCVASSIHALLFGENQLDNLLQSTLTTEALERLAVFPLDGFSSEETHEYICFKLATARFKKELPIGGGIIGAIHNSSEGMPGAINRLTIDALNTAAPISEPDEFTDLSPIFGGERIGQVEDIEVFESSEAAVSFAPEEHENVDSEQAWITSIQPRYWAAAATLVVLLSGILIFWDTAPRELESVPIAVAVTPASTEAIKVSSAFELTVAAPVQVVAIPEAAADVAELLVAGAVELDESNSPASAPAEDVIATSAVAATDNVPERAVSSEVMETIVELPEEQEASTIAAASTFVEQLLQASPKNYAVQLLASHSEANINEFVAHLAGDHPAGYFETRYQGKPWFVAVLAAFDDRAQAASAISSLPAKLRSNEPWIRSVAGIQSDTRELQGSRFVSLQ